MNHTKESIQDAIKLAQEASEVAAPSLRSNAFEVVLEQLFGARVLPGKESNLGNGIKKRELKVAREQEQGTPGTFDAVRVGAQLGLTKEQVEGV